LAIWKREIKDDIMVLEIEIVMAIAMEKRRIDCCCYFQDDQSDDEKRDEEVSN